MQCCLNIHKFNKCNLAHIEAQGKKNNKNFTMCEKQNETKTTVVIQIKLTIYTALKNPAKPWRIFSVSFHFVLILNWPRKFQSRACCAYFVQVNPTPCPSHGEIQGWQDKEKVISHWAVGPIFLCKGRREGWGQSRGRWVFFSTGTPWPHRVPGLSLPFSWEQKGHT